MSTLASPSSVAKSGVFFTLIDTGSLCSYHELCQQPFKSGEIVLKVDCGCEGTRYYHVTCVTLYFTALRKGSENLGSLKGFFDSCPRKRHQLEITDQMSQEFFKELNSRCQSVVARTFNRGIASLSSFSMPKTPEALVRAARSAQEFGRGWFNGGGMSASMPVLSGRQALGGSAQADQELESEYTAGSGNESDGWSAVRKAGSERPRSLSSSLDTSPAARKLEQSSSTEDRCVEVFSDSDWSDCLVVGPSKANRKKPTGGKAQVRDRSSVHQLTLTELPEDVDWSIHHRADYLTNTGNKSAIEAREERYHQRIFATKKASSTNGTIYIIPQSSGVSGYAVVWPKEGFSTPKRFSSLPASLPSKAEGKQALKGDGAGVTVAVSSSIDHTGETLAILSDQKSSQKDLFKKGEGANLERPVKGTPLEQELTFESDYFARTSATESGSDAETARRLGWTKGERQIVKNATLAVTTKERLSLTASGDERMSTLQEVLSTAKQLSPQIESIEDPSTRKEMLAALKKTQLAAAEEANVLATPKGRESPPSSDWNPLEDYDPGTW